MKLLFTTILALLLLQQVKAQTLIQERSSITAQSTNDGKGVGSATAYLDYVVRRHEGKVMFSLSYSRVTIDGSGGYFYKGKKYGNEVDGLVEKLNRLGGSAPKVNFDIYYGNIKQGSFTSTISAFNDLGVYSGDWREFPTTKDKLDNPNWRLVATGMETFNYSPDPTAWMNLDELVVKYERGKKDKSDYEEMVKEADQLYQSKQLKEALSAYIKAGNHHLADAHPKQQIEKIKTELANNDREANYKDLMERGIDAEKNKDYTSALSFFKSAAKTGFNEYDPQNAINRVNRVMNDLKKKQEEEIKNKEKDEKRKLDEIQKKLAKDKDVADKIIDEKEEELEEQNEAELNKLKKEQDKADREKLNDAIKEKLKKEEADRKQREKEKAEGIKKEQKDRRDNDSETIDKYEEDMSYDPYLYHKWVTLADAAYDKGNAINPYAALEIKNAWWDVNPHMESFREGLNEPRRQEAFQKSIALQLEMEGNYDAAKYYYMTAIKYTDRDSRQHKYLLSRIESMNRMIDFQKMMIESSREGEQQRQINYENARQYKIAKRLVDNKAKAVLLYNNFTRGTSYPTFDGKQETNNVFQQQMNFENRLNAADQHLMQNQAVTGITSQLAVGAMLDDSKTTRAYANHSMGINLFALTGYGGYPVVANDVPQSGYVPETLIETLHVAPFQGGMDIWLHRGKVWDVGITGDFSLGVLPMMGYQNFMFSYGGNLKVNAGIKAIKLAMELDYHNRSGNYYYDQDVALADQNNPYQQATNRILEGEFNYSVLKLGTGLNINFADETNDGYLRLMMYAEHPSFITNFKMEQPVLSFGSQLVFRGGITITFDYAQNYPAAGKAENVITEYTSRDFWKFGFGKTWTIAKTK